MALGKSWLHSDRKMVWPLLLTAATGQRLGLLRRTMAGSLAGPDFLEAFVHHSSETLSRREALHSWEQGKLKDGWLA